MNESGANRATDQQYVDWLAGHIEAPCTVDVGGEVHDIREFYVRELRRVLPTLTDPAARTQAEEILRRHEPGA